MYQGVRNVRFSENFAYFVFFLPPFFRFTLLPYYRRIASQSYPSVTLCFIDCQYSAAITELIKHLIVINIAPLTVLFCNCPLFCNYPLAYLYNFIQSGVACSQITRNSIQKKFLLLEINTIRKSLLFKLKQCY